MGAGLFVSCSVLGGGNEFYSRGRIEDDAEITMLRKSLPYLIKNGVANSTYGKYYGAWEKWTKWSAEKKLVSRPADPFYVAIYLNHLLFVNKTKGAITSAFYGVRWGHRVVGLESPTDNPLTKLAYEGALRLCGGEKIKKDPIPVETIKSVVEKYSYEKLDLMSLRFGVVCLIGFAGFLRIDELLNTKLKNVTIFADHMKIYLPKSKTDQHREGEKVVIARTGTRFCPVGQVEKFLTEAKLDIERNKDAYIVPRLHKTRKGHKASKTKGISKTTMSEIFQKNTASFRKEDENFGLHSLRSGGASSAANHGVPDRLISKQGRWASESARNGYIKDNKKARMSVSLALGL